MAKTPPKLTFDDIKAAAIKLNVSVYALMAVKAIECRGRGFKGDRPVILFERHVFYRNLAEFKRAMAVKAGLATRRWLRGYLKTQNARYKRLAKAMKIDTDAALKACSYGIGQVLGENWRLCGFASIQEFVEYQFASEAKQLETMCRFIKAKKLDVNLRNLDWSGFAYGYNGSGYKKHKYHIRLANAYKKAGGASGVTAKVKRYILRFGAAGEHVKILQKQLKRLGFNIGVDGADGVFGRDTARAVKAFQKQHGLVVDALVGGKTKRVIKAALKGALK